MTALHDLGPATTQLRSRWWLFVILGALLLVLGFLALANQFTATVASVYYIGVLMLTAGIAQIIHSFNVRGWGSFAFWLLGGLVYAVAGVSAFYNPLLAASVFTLVLAVTLVLAGLMRLTAGLQHRDEKGWGWIVTSGAVTLLAGIVIALGWPVNTLWVLGLILAVDLTMQGAALVAFGVGLKSGTR